MEPISSDWNERLDKAKTPEDFIGLLNEILRSADTSSTNKDDPASSTTGPLIPLSPST